MDVFNLLNATNVTGVNTTYGRVFGTPAATFMQPTRVSPTRDSSSSRRAIGSEKAGQAGSGMTGSL